jgi:cation/acetate symporter
MSGRIRFGVPAMASSRNGKTASTFESLNPNAFYIGIVAAAGAVANDLVDRSLGLSKNENSKVLIAKFTAVGVGITAMILGILLRGMNVGFLVGWAFAVAASANFPAILMVLFWKRTTAQGIIASIFVGIVSSMGIILLGPDMFEIYGLQRQDALIPIGQPGIISIPLSFLVLVTVSLLTERNKNNYSLLQKATQ